MERQRYALLPRRTVNQQTRWTSKIQRKAILIGCSPSQFIWRTWRHMCSHIPLKERSQIRKVRLQKWRYKNGSTVFFLTAPETNRDLFPRAVKFGDLIAAEHSSQWYCESRNNHRYAVVVQVLATRWIQSYPVYNQNLTGDGEEFMKVSGAVAEAESYSHERFIRIWQVLRRIIMESSNNCRTSCTSS